MPGARVIQIVSPGMLTVVQDLGRRGWEAYGIPRGGAADGYSYRWANRLALNEVGAGVLETTLDVPAFRVSHQTWLATTGVEEVAVDGASYPGWAGFWVRAGAMVVLGKPTGARAYVAFHGGVAVPPVLGSRATDLASGLGGFCGRALRGGDELPVGEETRPLPDRHESLRVPVRRFLHRPVTVPAVPGPRDGEFSAEASVVFFSSTYRMSPHSDAMGVRLDGPAIPTPPQGTRVSEPMPVGGVQITPAGQPILLLAGRGTIGGYPLLATASTVGVWRMAQVRPGDHVRFYKMSVAEARAQTRELVRQLHSIEPVLRRI